MIQISDSEIPTKADSTDDAVRTTNISYTDYSEQDNMTSVSCHQNIKSGSSDSMSQHDIGASCMIKMRNSDPCAQFPATEMPPSPVAAAGTSSHLSSQPNAVAKRPLHVAEMGHKDISSGKTSNIPRMSVSAERPYTRKSPVPICIHVDEKNAIKSSRIPRRLLSASKPSKDSKQPSLTSAYKRSNYDGGTTTKIPRPEKSVSNESRLKSTFSIKCRSVLERNNPPTSSSEVPANTTRSVDKSTSKPRNNISSSTESKSQSTELKFTPLTDLETTNSNSSEMSSDQNITGDLLRNTKYGEKLGYSVSQNGVSRKTTQSKLVNCREGGKHSLSVPDVNVRNTTFHKDDISDDHMTRRTSVNKSNLANRIPDKTTQMTRQKGKGSTRPSTEHRTPSRTTIRGHHGVTRQNSRSQDGSLEDVEVYIEHPRPSVGVNNIITGVSGGTVQNAFTAGTVYGDVGNRYDFGFVHVGSLVTQNQFINENVRPGYNNVTYTQDQIKELLNEACNPFIETTGYTEAKSRLDSSGHVTLIGEAGSGKTTIGYRLLKLYKESKHFTPLLVDNVDELKHLQDPNEPTIFFVNDVFGRSSYSASKLQMFLTVFKHLEKVLKPDKNRIIFSSRNYIFRDALPDLILYQDTFFSDNSVVDLSGGAMLTKSDKEKLLQTFAKRADVTISDENIQKIVEMDTAYGFPHACDMFSKMKKWHTRPLQFFRKPIDVLIESVQHLSHWDKDKFAVLLLIILSDGHFNLAKLRKESDLPEGIRGYISMQRLSEFVSHRHQIAFPLIGSYLSSSGDTLSFRHPTVEDTVAYVIGNMDPLFLINHCSMRVVYERIRIHPSEGTGSTQPTQGDIQWFHVVISDDYHDDLVSRLWSEIGRENFNLVCIHQACSEKKFIEKLFLALDENNEPITGNLFHKADRKYRQTFLQWAVMNQSEALCEQILKLTQFSILEKLNAMIACCVTGNSKAIDLLINSLSPLGIRMLTKFRVNKLDMMVINDSEETNIQEGSGNRYSLLHIACNYGHRDVVALLLKSSFSIDCVGDFESPLHGCCRKGHIDILMILVENGANMEAKMTFWLETPLHVCCQYRQLAAVQKCVELGADIEAKGFDRKTPLLNACRGGDQHIVEYLIDHGAEKEVQDYTGSTPLIDACIRGYYNVVQCLVKKGANMETTNRDGKTPLMEACSRGHDAIADFLIESGAGIDDPDGYLLHCACQGGCLNVAKYILTNQTNAVMTMQREKKINFLNSAATGTCTDNEDNKYAITQLLIALGADVNAVNEDNKAPVMVALENGYRSIVSLLIENGAMMSVIGKDGQTVFHKAAKGDIASLICNMTPGSIPVSDGDSVENKNDFPSDCNETVKQSPSSRGQIPLDSDVLSLINMTDKNKETALHVAARFGDSASVKSLLNLPVGINAINKDQETALHIAAKRPNLDVLQILLEHGADVHSKDFEMKTPLHVAAKYGTVTTVKLFLDMKADINAVDQKNQTALHKALDSKGNEIALVLINYGADIYIKDNNNQTPMHVAAEYGNCEILEKILAMKPNINATDDYSQTPLHLATVSSMTDNVQILLNNEANVNVIDIYGMQPLHHAASLGKWDILQILLENGAEVDAITVDEIRNTSLHLAAMKDISLYSVYVLLEHQANINAVDKNGQTPLHIAASRCDAGDTARLLLDREAETNAADKENRTPLHVAANLGDTDIIQALIDKNADVNAKDCRLQTPLHIAVSRELDTVHDIIVKDAKLNMYGISEKRPEQLIAEVVQVFMNSDASINVIDNNHQTPLHLATLKMRTEIVRLLLKCSADVNITDGRKRTSLHLAVLSGRSEIIQMMVDRKVPINAVDENGETALHLATYRRDTSTSKLLLDNGAEVNAKSTENKTPLHIAVTKCSKLIPLLLENKAEVDAADNKGMTPLHLAATMREYNSLESLLLHHPKANVNIRNESGQTPLHLAAGKGYVKQVEMLLINMADVNAKDVKKQTPLHMAAKCETELMTFMVDTSNKTLKKGTVKKIVQKAKAKMFNHAEICQILIRFESDIHAKDETNKTPLHLAAEFGHANMVHVLLNNGADVNAVDVELATPLQLAQKHKHTEVTDILLGNKLTESCYSEPTVGLPLYD